MDAQSDPAASELVTNSVVGEEGDYDDAIPILFPPACNTVARCRTVSLSKVVVGFANGPAAGVNVASPAPPRMYGAELNYTF